MRGKINSITGIWGAEKTEVMLPKGHIEKSSAGF
jgi:hypothetical protein